MTYKKLMTIKGAEWYFGMPYILAAFLQQAVSELG
jgi:hypothetical protein